LTIVVGPYPNPTKIPCNHPRCDGRPARWTFPQINAEITSVQPLSCNVHLARFAETLLAHLTGGPAFSIELVGQKREGLWA
jgi:hypothetical protein